MRQHQIPGNVPGNHTNNYYENRERSRQPAVPSGSIDIHGLDNALRFEDATRLQQVGAAAAALALAIGLNVFAAPIETHAPQAIAASQETGTL